MVPHPVRQTLTPCPFFFVSSLARAVASRPKARPARRGQEHPHPPKPVEVVVVVAAAAAGVVVVVVTLCPLVVVVVVVVVFCGRGCCGCGCCGCCGCCCYHFCYCFAGSVVGAFWNLGMFSWPVSFLVHYCGLRWHPTLGIVIAGDPEDAKKVFRTAEMIRSAIRGCCCRQASTPPPGHLRNFSEFMLVPRPPFAMHLYYRSLAMTTFQTQ